MGGVYAVLDLPIRQETFTITDDVTGVTCEMMALTPAEADHIQTAEWFNGLMEKVAAAHQQKRDLELKPEDVQTAFFCHLFDEHVRSLSVTMDGAAFAPDDPTHLRSVPRDLKMTLALQLVMEDLTAASIVGNSPPPAGASEVASRQASSTGAADDSSTRGRSSESSEKPHGSSALSVSA